MSDRMNYNSHLQIYDPTYLDFVSNVLSSSRYYTNLQNQYLSQHYEDVEQNEETVGTVLYCKPEDSIADTQGNYKSNEYDNADEDGEADIMVDDVYDSNENENCENASCNSKSLSQTQEYSLNQDTIKVRPDSRKKTKTKHKTKRSSKAKSVTHCNDFDLKGLLLAVAEIEVQKKLHADIFDPSAEGLKDFQEMYGSDANAILQLEQEQELAYQKACEKITPTLPKCNFPKS